MASAKGAAGQCVGGDGKRTCGAAWNETTWDGTSGMGQDMSALAVVQSMMLRVDDSLEPPLSLDTGGESKSDPTAGTDTNEDPTRIDTLDRITTGDKAGAGILTAILLLTITGGSYWLIK